MSVAGGSNRELKLAVQRRAAVLAASINDGDAESALAAASDAFRARDRELAPLLRRTARAELIGTVATRTLLRLFLADGDDRTVELLWRDHGDGDWRIEDARLFSLLPEEA